MARPTAPPVMSVFMFPSLSRTIVREFVHQQTGQKTAACTPVAGARKLGSCVRKFTHPKMTLFKIFRWPSQMGVAIAKLLLAEGIVSKRLGSRYTSGRTRDWLKMKNPDASAVKREAEEDWGR